MEKWGWGRGMESQREGQSHGEAEMDLVGGKMLAVWTHPGGSWCVAGGQGKQLESSYIIKR